MAKFDLGEAKAALERWVERLRGVSLDDLAGEAISYGYGRIMRRPAGTGRRWGVATIGGRKVAVGLRWLVLRAADRGSEAVARQRAGTIGATLYGVRGGLSQQLCASAGSGSGHRPGMMAAAAMLADSLQGSWIGIFRLPEGWWYVDVRDDAVLPEGDQLFSRPEDAVQCLTESTARHSYDRVYAPEALGLKEANPGINLVSNPVEDLIKRNTQRVGLKPMGVVARAAFTLRYVAAAAVIVLCVGLVYQWFVGEEELRRQMQALQQTSTGAFQLQQAPAPPPPPPAWSGKLAAADVMDACEAAVMDGFRVLHGWNLVRMDCENRRVTAFYQRVAGGIVQELQQFLAAGPVNGELRVINNGTDAYFSWALDLGGASEVSAPVSGEAELSQRLWSTFGSLGVDSEKLVLSKPPAPSRPAVLPGTPAPPMPAFTPSMVADATSVFPPSVWSGALGLPGAVAEKVSYTFADNRWRYVVQIYLR